MRRTHVHVSDSGSVWMIHEDPYNGYPDPDPDSESESESESES